MFGGGYEASSDRSLKIPLLETMRLAWADPDLRTRLMFVFWMFTVFVIGVHIQVPIPGVSPDEFQAAFKGNGFLDLINMFGGGALRRLSIFSLGLNPYITAQIIMQILTMSNPKWKQEQREEGEYGRQKQTRRVKILMLFLCVAQSIGYVRLLGSHIPQMNTPFNLFVIITMWTAGAMFTLWLGEQITLKGIGNGVSLMIFAGIIISLPTQFGIVYDGLKAHTVPIAGVIALVVAFLLVTWLIVLVTTAQRRIPIQHMRQNVGTRIIGGKVSYLPLGICMAGVIPIIFAVSLIYIPAQFESFFPATNADGTVNGFHSALANIAFYLNPLSGGVASLIACLLYTAMIFFFTYFYTAVQFNGDDISDNLRRSGSFIPGVRPGKQTKDFLDGVISRVTVVGALFLAVVALVQYLGPVLTNVRGLSVIGGTTLLIMVSVALDTMRQIEANLLMKKYGQ